MLEIIRIILTNPVMPPPGSEVHFDPDPRFSAEVIAFIHSDRFRGGLPVLVMPGSDNWRRIWPFGCHCYGSGPTLSIAQGGRLDQGGNIILAFADRNGSPILAS